jgi:alkanesulfonate monooxygenase SsuD/methylene tetrahydromethanopterin reductase-like flavin-dependent oxidoreductase (luciferase family)
MDVGIGLPNAVPGTTGPVLLDWSRRAEQAGFSTLSTIGRLVYPSYEELIALSAAAAVTGRIRLTTGVLLAPLYTNAALLAKQAASLDQISGGRLVFGVGLGGRDDDFAASGLSTAGRGRRVDEQLETMKRIWAGQGTAGGPEAIGPPPAREGGPELIIGGNGPAAVRRTVRFGNGWMMGGGTPQMFAEGAAAVDKAWQDAGKPGRPRKLSLAYFALGPGAREAADGYLLRYYGFLGDIANQIAQSAAVTPEMVRGYIAAFEQSGCDELILDPCSSDPAQVELLAEAVHG